MNVEALYNISYGLYIVSSGSKKEGNAYIANTVFQITSEPPLFAVSCNKKNFTSEFIKKFKTFSVSILNQNAKAETIGNFGFRTGRKINKFENFDVRFGKTSVPIVINDSIAYMEFKLTDEINLGTHILFIGELVDAQLIAEGQPLTYDYYRKIKKGFTPKNAPSYIKKEKKQKSEGKIYKCNVCGHIYDNNIEKIKFEDLPDNWTCPTCGVGKEEFSEI
ncbi:MAG: flavin reductase [Bacteroidales bacterium]|nr:flavin reductase [Bacteroidales bacterium]